MGMKLLTGANGDSSLPIIGSTNEMSSLLGGGGVGAAWGVGAGGGGGGVESAAGVGAA